MSESYSYRIGLFPAPEEVGKTASILCPTGYELISVTLAAQSTIGRPALILATFRRLETAQFMLWSRVDYGWYFGSDIETGSPMWTTLIDNAVKFSEDAARALGVKLCGDTDFREVDERDPVLLVRCVPE